LATLLVHVQGRPDPVAQRSCQRVASSDVRSPLHEILHDVRVPGFEDLSHIDRRRIEAVIDEELHDVKAPRLQRLVHWRTAARGFLNRTGLEKDLDEAVKATVDRVLER
jgi:hypothetical protein